MTKNRVYDLFPVAMLVMTIAAATTIAQAQTFSVLYNFGNEKRRSIESCKCGHCGAGS